MNTRHYFILTSAALVLLLVAGCGPTSYGGYAATLASPQTGAYLSQPGEIVKKDFFFPRAPAFGSRHPRYPNVVCGNSEPDFGGGHYVELLPAPGWRWANPSNLGDKRVVPAR